MFQALFVGVAAVVGGCPYLLPSGGSVAELTEHVTADGGSALAVGGDCDYGRGLETG